MSKPVADTCTPRPTEERQHVSRVQEQGAQVRVPEMGNNEKHSQQSQLWGQESHVGGVCRHTCEGREEGVVEEEWERG